MTIPTVTEVNGRIRISQDDSSTAELPPREVVIEIDQVERLCRDLRQAKREIEGKGNETTTPSRPKRDVDV